MKTASMTENARPWDRPDSDYPDQIVLRLARRYKQKLAYIAEHEDRTQQAVLNRELLPLIDRLAQAAWEDETRKLRGGVDKPVLRLAQARPKPRFAERVATARAATGRTKPATGRVAARTGTTMRYRNPRNPTQTWMGRGQRPKWLKEALAAGRKLEEFKT